MTIRPGELAGGATLFHEHMQLAPDFGAKFGAATAAARAANGLPPAPARGGGGGRQAPPPGPDIMHDVDLMSAEVDRRQARRNIACIVDAGHPDMGRDVNFLRQVSMKSGVPIVVGGGFYSQPWYPKEISTMSEEQIVRALIKQVDDDVVGVFGEIGSWDEITADERKVFRAVGTRARRDEHSDLHAHRHSRESRRSNSSTSSKTPASSPSTSSSATSAISSTRTSTCTRRSAGAARSSASIGRAATTTRSRCRW